MKSNPKHVEFVAIIKKQEMSGLSVRRFCIENQISECQFNYYKKRKSSTVPKRAFTAVKIAPPKIAKPVMTYTDVKIDPIWLAEFLKVLVGKR